MAKDATDRAIVRLLAGYKSASADVADIKAARKDAARKVAARYTRGNIAIQRGSYVTADELEEKREALRRRHGK